MGLFGPKPGMWWVESVLDPRWDGHGRAEALSLASRPREAEEHVAAKQKEFGDPPADLEFGWEKD
jgi:hypothetical protein